MSASSSPYATPVEQILAEAVEIADPLKRQEYLDHACGGDVARRQEVERLVRNHLAAGSFLETPPSAVVIDSRPTMDQPLTERPGTQIGPYKLLQIIGEGGMGVVYMAEQQEPVLRRVALKVIKPGMDSRQVIARFEAERQALAMMEHPNIAKVLDGGTTESGRPYFVMELVRGIPITKYCDEHHLTLKERLELFVPVCQAVQHAHQKGIVHRDLKPTNVLVAEYDNRPVPKIIDFGVAKAMSQPLTEKTMFTEFGQVVGTLEYMSPEQAKLNQLDIDTRSDIYSLGVLLYELLTGTTPFDRKRLQSAAFDEMLRIIREEEPPKPSTRLSSPDTLPSIAANRHIEPARLTKLVRGELDWIVMKALEKDRNRRYETASGFAMDVQRYLADEPVLACPPSWAYRLRKGLRRNKGPVLAASLIVAALVVGTVAASWQAIRARQAEARAIQERDAKDDALKAEQRARQEAVRAGAQTLKVLRAMTGAIMSRRLATQVELNDSERAFFDDVLNHYESLATIKGGSPESRALRAEGYYRIGIIRYRLQQWREALPAFEQARRLYQELAADLPATPEYRSWMAKCHHFLGQVLVEMGRPTDALEELRRSLTQFQELEAGFPDSHEYHDSIGATYGQLAHLFGAQGQFVEAELHFRQAVRADEYFAGIFPKAHEYQERIGRWHLGLGLIFEKQNKQIQAEEEVRQALTIQKKLAADFPDVPYRKDVASCHRHLARLLAAQDKRTEAEAEYRAALVIEHKLAADFPAIPAYRRNLAKSLWSLGNLLLDLDKAKDAEAEYRQALALQNRLVADFPDVPSYADQLAQTYSSLGIALENQAMLDQAIMAYRRAAQLKPQWPSAYNRLLEAMSKAGRLDAVIAEYEAQLDRDPDDPFSHYLLGRIHFQERHWENAATHFTKVLALNAGYPEIRAKRGAAYAALGRWEEAITDYSKESELRPNVPALQNDLAWLLATCPDAQHRNPGRAVTAARRAVELAPTNGIFWRTLGAAHYRAADWTNAIQALEKSIQLRNGGDSFSWFFLAMANWRLGEKDAARQWYDRGVQWMKEHKPSDEQIRRLHEEADELMKQESEATDQKANK